MRRLWVPLSLLILLLILCSWQHRNSFNRPMQYMISQDGTHYTLSGDIRSQKEIDQLRRWFASEHRILDTKGAKLDALLLPGGGFAALQKLIPLLTSSAHQAKIRYQDNRLQISAIVEEEEDKAEIEKLLHETEGAADGEITVVKPEPVHFEITQRGRRAYEMEGMFTGTMQKAALQHYFKSARASLKTAHGDIDPALQDRADIIKKLEQFIPFFVAKVQQGALRYHDGILYVEGKVMRKRRIEEIDALLGKLGIEGRNRVTLNIQAIRGRRAKKKAQKMVAALQKQRAQKEAVSRAEKAVFKDVAAMNSPSQEAQKIAIDNKEVRKNLKTLFETEIIEFNTAQTTLTPVGVATVSKIALILKAYPDVKIEIAGHTDSDGDDAFNMLLSQGRVNNVKRALMREGIEKNRIKAVGYGETKPLVPNTTRENKQKNRRVEIIVIGE